MSAHLATEDGVVTVLGYSHSVWADWTRQQKDLPDNHWAKGKRSGCEFAGCTFRSAKEVPWLEVKVGHPSPNGLSYAPAV